MYFVVTFTGLYKMTHFMEAKYFANMWNGDVLMFDDKAWVCYFPKTEEWLAI